MNRLATKEDIAFLYRDIKIKMSDGHSEPPEKKVNAISEQILELKLDVDDLVTFKKYWLKVGDKPFNWKDIRNWSIKNKTRNQSSGGKNGLCSKNICCGDNVVEVSNKSLSGSEIRWCPCYSGDEHGIMKAPFSPDIDSLEIELNKIGYELSKDFMIYRYNMLTNSDKIINMLPEMTGYTV